jgi:two-component system, NarL family, invasion response regulator UvrY
MVHFTNREKELLFYCCSEMPYKEIAMRMGISMSTLSNYREELGVKLNVHTRVGLVLYAFKKGIVKVENLPGQ